MLTLRDVPRSWMSPTLRIIRQVHWSMNILTNISWIAFAIGMRQFGLTMLCGPTRGARCNSNSTPASRADRGSTLPWRSTCAWRDSKAGPDLVSEHRHSSRRKVRAIDRSTMNSEGAPRNTAIRQPGISEAMRRE